eukprot:1647622-Rhodomonas_salina.2
MGIADSAAPRLGVRAHGFKLRACVVGAGECEVGSRELEGVGGGARKGCSRSGRDVVRGGRGEDPGEIGGAGGEGRGGGK